MKVQPGVGPRSISSPVMYLVYLDTSQGIFLYLRTIRQPSMPIAYPTAGLHRKCRIVCNKGRPRSINDGKEKKRYESNIKRWHCKSV